MSVALLGLDLSLVVARLRDASLCPSIKLLGEAADFEAATESGPAKTPAVFVMLLRDSSGANGLASGGVRQTVIETIGVVFAVENKRDARGAAALASLRSPRGEAKEALLGWVPATGYDFFLRGPGRLMGVNDGVLWWMDEYHTRHFDSKV